MKLSTSNLEQPIAFLQHIISQGGPEKKEYDALNQIFDLLSDEFKSGRLSTQELELLQNGFGDECMENTLHGHIKSKPYGYAGDFMIIDKIYRQQITKDYRFAKWDIFWNNHSAAKAVRNRKEYFIKTMTHLLSTHSKLRLLNVASGPARDLKELYQQIDPERLYSVCVEADNTAINFAKNLNEDYLHQINFLHQNIFRFNTTEKFDVIWSAGLFDYFDDNIFIKLLRKFVTWTKPGGEVIIGNFSRRNPSRNYMELIGDWYLHHRSEEELTEMAIAAGISGEQIFIGKELEGVNLFLHIKV